MKDIDCYAIEIKIMDKKIEECKKRIEELQKIFVSQVEKCHRITKELDTLNIFKRNLEAECEDRKQKLETCEKQIERETLKKEITSKQHTLEGIMARKYALHPVKKEEDIKAVEIKFELDNNYELISMLTTEKEKIYEQFPRELLEVYKVDEKQKGVKKQCINN